MRSATAFGAPSRAILWILDLGTPSQRPSCCNSVADLQNILMRLSLPHTIGKRRSERTRKFAVVAWQVVGLVLGLAMDGSAIEREVFGRYVLIQEFTEESPGAPRVNAYALVEVAHQRGATSYRLMSRGGSDPFFYGDKIDLGAPTFLGDSLVHKPDGVHWWFLSGGGGPAEDAGSQADYFNGRFASGWDWRVIVTEPEFNATISAAPPEVAIGEDMHIEIFVVNRRAATIRDVQVVGDLIVAGDGVVESVSAPTTLIGDLPPGGSGTLRRTYTALEVGEVSFSATLEGRPDDAAVVTVDARCDDLASLSSAACSPSGPTVEIAPCTIDVSLGSARLVHAELVGDFDPGAHAGYAPGGT